MPKSDAEKVTVKGSHGDSSLQRESDSSRVKRDSSPEHTPRTNKNKNTLTPEDSTHKIRQIDPYVDSPQGWIIKQAKQETGQGPRLPQGHC